MARTPYEQGVQSCRSEEEREVTSMDNRFMATGSEHVHLDQLYIRVQETLAKALKIGRVNSLEALQDQTQLKHALEEDWKQLTQVYSSIEDSLKRFPLLPAWEQIQWAQHTLGLPGLAFMEIDTTGLEYNDEMIRFTLIDKAGNVLEDCLIKPTTRVLGPQASAINGIKPEQLYEALPIIQAWERIQQALRDRSVMSFGLEWDQQQLDRAARRHGLARIRVRGECLQRQATRYYQGEYGLRLAELCARAGAPLPDHPHQTSLDRAQGQRVILQAFAQAITDVRPPVAHAAELRSSLDFEGVTDDFDPFLDANDFPN